MSIIKEEDLVFIGKEIRENGESSKIWPGGANFLLDENNLVEYLILKYTLQSLGYLCVLQNVDRKVDIDNGRVIVSKKTLYRYVYTNYPFEKLIRTV